MKTNEVILAEGVKPISEAVIDSSQVRENVERSMSFLPENCKMLAVVKADAYGHGIVGMAKILEKIPSVHMLAVASLDEALDIYYAGISKKILILYQTLPEYIQEVLLRYSQKERKKILDHFIFSAYSTSEVECYEQLGQEFGMLFSIHVRLDFYGGIRGLSRSDYERDKFWILFAKDVHICGLYAHAYICYQEDERRAREVLESYAAAFREIPEGVRPHLTLHLLTSVSFFKYPEYAFDMVRLGAALYGMPLLKKGMKDIYPCPEVKPVMVIRSMVTNIIQTTNESSFDYIGKLSDEVREVALVSIGSWDIPNFFRGEELYTCVKGHLCKVVGEPCMDSCCIDITGIDDIFLGDEVFFLGDSPGIRLAEQLKRNSYDIYDCQMLFAGMSRLPKRYV